MNTSGENWRDVPGYKGRYQVSDLGRVRSLPRTITERCRAWRKGRTYTLSGTILKPCRLSNGYQRINLCVHGRQKGYYVHSLVLLAFVGPCPPGMECCHGDGNRMNNRLGNLRWDSRLNNAADRVRHGHSCRGERNGAAKLSTADVHAIRYLHSRGVGPTDLARQFGCNRYNIRAVAQRKTWRHV
jgi:hypothetical protein